MAAANFPMAQLAPRAAKLPAPQDVTLKADKDLKLIGKSGEAPGHARQGQRQGAVRHRCAHGRAQDRHLRGFARGGRQGRPCRQVHASVRACSWWCWTTSWRGGPPFLGREEGPGLARHRLGRRRERADRFRQDRGGAARHLRQKTACWPRKMATPRRRWPARTPTLRRRLSNCRSCRMRRWSRRISPSM